MNSELRQCPACAALKPHFPLPEAAVDKLREVLASPVSFPLGVFCEGFVCCGCYRPSLTLTPVEQTDSRWIRAAGGRGEPAK